MRKGVVLAASSYVAWGLFPAYFFLLKAVLAHRGARASDDLVAGFPVRRAGVSPAMVVASPAGPATRAPRDFTVSAALLSGNWFLYIWAVTSGHVIDASLGYFINPLVNIVLGFALAPRTAAPRAMVRGRHRGDRSPVVDVARAPLPVDRCRAGSDVRVLWLDAQGCGARAARRPVARDITFIPVGGCVSGVDGIHRKQRVHTSRFRIATFADRSRADNRDTAAAVRRGSPAHQAFDPRTVAIHRSDAAVAARHLDVSRALRRRARLGLRDHLGGVGLVFRRGTAAQLVVRAAMPSRRSRRAERTNAPRFVRPPAHAPQTSVA